MNLEKKNILRKDIQKYIYIFKKIKVKLTK